MEIPEKYTTDGRMVKVLSMFGFSHGYVRRVGINEMIIHSKNNGEYEIYACSFST